MYHFHMIAQKVYLLLENLDQFSSIGIGFVPVLMFLIDIYSELIMRLNPDFK